MSNLMVLENKELTIKSVELVDIINQFREVEGNRAVLGHDNFKAKIEKEIETLKSFGITNVLNFKVVKYKDAMNLSALPRKLLNLSKAILIASIHGPTSRVFDITNNVR